MHYDFIGVIEQMECKSVCAAVLPQLMHYDFIGVIEQMDCKSVCAAVLPQLMNTSQCTMISLVLLNRWNARVCVLLSFLN